MGAKAIGTLGIIDTITMGGRVFTDLSTLIMIIAQVDATSKSTFRKPSAVSGYQVTAGKTLTIRAVKIHCNTAGSPPDLLYSDNDVGMTSATAYINSVLLAGSNSITLGPVVNTSGNTIEYPLDFAVPATKFPGAVSGSGSGNYSVLALAYET